MFQDTGQFCYNLCKVLANDGPQAKSDSLLVFLNKVLLAHTTPTHLHIMYMVAFKLQWQS